MKSRSRGLKKFSGDSLVQDTAPVKISWRNQKFFKSSCQQTKRQTNRQMAG